MISDSGYNSIKTYLEDKDEEPVKDRYLVLGS